MPPTWLDWAQRLQAIAQSGITYSTNQYDLERYEALREIAAEIMAAGSDAAIDPIRDLFAAQTGYATPKVDMRAAVFRDGRILLVEERADGTWSLPGGWADINESPADAIVREVREESGYETRAAKLLAVYDRNRHGHPPFPFHAYKLFFQCVLLGGEPSLSYEVSAVDWFAEDRLPTLSTIRVTAGQVHRCFAHYRNPGWPTDFD
ncbi:MAG TPA: NUDIX hydrolase [Bryobacteraceae bacterium]|jgi:ADP-ribose pyrophosphatase YjhB (NUDIX family)|nr:NUDIX hydrolase [Bryobacteraceae bacterium]